MWFDMSWVAAHWLGLARHGMAWFAAHCLFFQQIRNVADKEHWSVNGHALCVSLVNARDQVDG